MVRTHREPAREASNGSQEASPFEALFLEHLPHVERAATTLGRQAGLPEQEVEDFVSQVRLKLINQDYRALRQYAGKAKLTTYLHVLIANELRDVLDKKYGKYRPSQKARNLGPLAVELEALLVRDGHDIETAIGILSSRPGPEPPTRQELHSLAAELPQRTRRRFVGEEALSCQATDGGVENRLRNAERMGTAKQVRDLLDRGLGRLSAREQLVVRLHFEDGHTLSSVAKSLSIQPRTVYSIKDRAVRELRRTFDSAGLSWDAVRELFSSADREIETDFRPK